MSDLPKTVLPFFIINWTFGLGIVQYPFGRPHPIISFIYSLLCIISYSVISVISYPYILEWVFVSQEIIISAKILLQSNIVLTTSVIIISWWRGEGMMRCFVKLHEIILLMNAAGVSHNLKKMLRSYVPRIICSIIFISTILTINLILILSREGSVIVKVLATITICYPVIIMFISDSSFLTYLCILEYKLSMLNKHLRRSLTSKDDCPQHKKIIRTLISLKESSGHNSSGVTQNYSTELVKAVKKIHLKLVKACDEANDTYGYQILLSIMVAYVVITGHLYKTYVMLLNDEISRTTLYGSIISSSTWTLFYGNRICCFSVVSSRCKQSSVMIGDTINEFYDDISVDNETKAEIRDFNMQMSQKPLIFTAGRIISLDTCLIQKAISTITTYLVILVQLGKSA